MVVAMSHVTTAAGCWQQWTKMVLDAVHTATPSVQTWARVQAALRGEQVCCETSTTGPPSEHTTT